MLGGQSDYLTESIFLLMRHQPLICYLVYFLEHRNMYYFYSSIIMIICFPVDVTNCQSEINRNGDKPCSNRTIFPGDPTGPFKTRSYMFISIIQMWSIWYVPHTYECHHGQFLGSPCMTDFSIKEI